MDNVESTTHSPLIQSQVLLSNLPQPCQKLADIIGVNTADEGVLFDAMMSHLQHDRDHLVKQALPYVKGLRDSRGYSLFFACIANGHLAEVKKIFQNHWEHQLSDEEWENGLHIAVRHNQEKMMDFLCSCCSMNRKNTQDRTPLHEAIVRDRSSLIVPLMEAGASAGIKCDLAAGGAQLPAAALAVSLGYTRCLKQLATKVSLKTVRVSGIGNLLHVAIRYNQIGVLRNLLTEHWQIIKGLIHETGEDEHERTPLMLAAFTDDVDSIRLLHGKGAILDTKDGQNRRALHWAFLGKSRNAINVLWELGADLHGPDVKGRRPVDLLDKKDSTSKSLFALYMYLSGLTDVHRNALPLEKLPPTAAIFKGGGPKGFAYVGAVEEFERLKLIARIRRVAGTSAGAINAGLMAIGCNSEAMRELLKGPGGQGFVALFDRQWKNKKAQKSVLGTVLRWLSRPVGDFIDEFKLVWRNAGVCLGEKARTWLEGIIKNQTGISFCTFAELALLVEKQPEKFKHLHVFATRIGNASKLIHFSSEKNEEGKLEHGNVIISDAIRASMSIPGAFVPHAIYTKNLSGEREKVGKNNLVDGGLINNLPHRVFDRECYIRNGGSQLPAFNKRVIVFSLYSPASKLKSIQGVTNLWDLLLRVAGIYYQAEGLILSLHDSYKTRIVKIDNKGVGMLDFNLSKVKINMLIQSGKLATRQFFGDKITGLAEQPQKERRIGLKNVPDLFGCDSIIEILHRKLVPDPTWRQDSKTEICVLCAADGWGKSDIARKFANTYSKKFSAIYWVDAGTPETLYSAYHDIASELKCASKEGTSVATLIKAVNQALERSPATKPKLLILNNSKNALILPTRGVSVLVTTMQGHEWPNNRINMESLDSRDAQQLVRRLSGESDRKAVEDVIKTVGAFPFPLVLASACMKQQNCSAYGYLQLYDRIKDSDLTFEGNRLDVKSLERTVMISLGKLKKQKLLYDTLMFCLAFDPCNLPSRWIKSWLQKHKNVPPFKINSQMKAILRTLVDYRLISSDPCYELLSINSLLHVILRRVCDQTYRPLAPLALTIVAEDRQKDFTWLSHAIRVLKYDGSSKHKGEIHIHVGELKLRLQDREGAMAHYQDAMLKLGDAYGESSLEYARVLYQLALLYPKQAVSNLLKAAAIAKAKKNKLLYADCYLQLGSVRMGATAKENLQTALKIYEEEQKQAKKAETYLRLGEVCLALKDRKVSRSFFNKAFILLGRLYGKEHLSNISCIIGLAKSALSEEEAMKSATEAIFLIQKYVPHRSEDLKEMRAIQRDIEFDKLRKEGNSWMEKRNYRNAIQKYQSALDLKQNARIRLELAKAHKKRGNAHEGINDDEAKRHWEKARDLFRAVGDHQKVEEMNSKLSFSCIIL